MSHDLIEKFSAKRDLMIMFKEKQGDSNEIFTQLMNDRDIKKLFASMAFNNIRNSPTTMLDQDDLVSIAFIEMWRALSKYKFICPVCGLKALTHNAYQRHVNKAHGTYLEPKPTIDKYILYNAGAYMQNAIRNEYNEGRKTNHSLNQVNLFSPQDEEENKSRSDIEFTGFDLLYTKNDLQDDVILKLIFEEFLNNEDEITRQIFYARFMFGYKNTDIADLLYRKGVYGTLQSASVMVSRKVKEIVGKITTIYPDITN